MAAPWNPLVVLSIAWLGGSLCARAIPEGSWQLGLALLTLSVGAVAAVWGLRESDTREARSGRAWLAGVCAAASCAGLAAGAAPTVRPPPAVPSGMARLSATVETSEPYPDGHARSVLHVIEGRRLEDGAELPRGIDIGAGPIALPVGARVRLLAKLVARAPFRNPSRHPPAPPRFELWGEAFIPGANSVQVLALSWPDAWLDRARARVRARLNETLSPRAAGMACALVLGDERVLEPEDQANIRNAGVLHVLAVSGLHVAILAGAFVALLRRALLRVPGLALRFDVRRLASALGVPFALGYAAFAGGAPSAWRAALTAALAWTLTALGRRPDAGAVSAFSALLLGALQPELVVRPAFLLSIVATAAILAERDALVDAEHGVAELLRAALRSSARALVATAPIVLWCFGSVPIVGLVANLVLLPLASLVLVQLSAAHALWCTLTPFSEPTAGLFGVASGSFLAACAAFSSLVPNRAWPPPDLAQGLLLCGVSVGLVLARGWRVRVATLTAAVLVLGACEWRLRTVEQPKGELRVTFLDVGQGDAALIDLPDRSAMLIDAGGSPGGGRDPGREVILPLLRARRRDRLAIAVLTHPHPDHYGGLAALLPEVKIDELWDSGQAEGEAELGSESREAASLIAQARARGARVRRPDELCGKSWNRGGARVQVLAPCPHYDPGYDPNDNSLVIRVDYGRRSFLFAGDAEQHAESVLLAAGTRLRADVLKVGHHGSRTSAGDAFLHAVAPSLAVISAGVGNRFGHPHPETLARLRSVPHVFNLAEDGGTIATTDGSRVQIRTWSGHEFTL